MKAPTSESRQTVLRKRVAKVPSEPGVYRWLDAEKNVLYVGKAKNLRKRMTTYVQDGVKRSPWTDMMVRHIADFDVTVVRSELEAFILESNLIKQIQPKYNVLLKDDKGYVYVRMSLQERYPRIDVVRKLESDGAKYFGPFLGARSTNETIDMLDSLLHFRSCKKSLDALNHGAESCAATSHTPCLDYQIGKCSGLCIDTVTREEYAERVSAVEKFFRGNVDSVKKKAHEQMQLAATEKKFERAAKFRDVVRFIEDLEKRQIISDASGENADIFGIALSHGKIQVVMLRERDGKVIEQLAFALRGEAETAREAMAQFLPQYYENTQDIPDVIILGESLPEAELLTSWLGQRHGRIVRTVIPERGKKSKLLEMAERNAEEKVQQQFAAWEAESKTVEEALRELASLAHLSSPPRRIEGYDISHLGGTATVGSMVVFVNGKPKREHYRSFNMQTVQEGAIDDYKSIKETLRRRLRYLTDDLKTSIARLYADNIEVGKAKKKDQKIIEEIIMSEPRLSPEKIEYEDFIVARSQDRIVATASLYMHEEDNILELKSVWVHKDFRGKKIGHILSKSLLSKLKKGKVYTIIDALPHLEEYYAELGFHHLHTPPSVLTQKEERFHAEHPDHQPGIILAYEVSKNKMDESFLSVPDLLLIDGGKGQLSAATEALEALGLKIPVAGLAKREEEIFLPGQSDSLVVSKDSPARFLLQRVRDEAHRFANARREKRLDRAMTHSKLDEVPGIGDITRAALLKRFRSADGVIEALDTDLLSVLTQQQLAELRQRFPR